MNSTPQDDSIYTLQRRIGQQRPFLRSDADAATSQVDSPRPIEPQAKRFRLVELFSLRIRAA